MVGLGLAAWCGLLAVLTRYRSGRWVSPVGVFFWLWAGLFVLAALQPVEFTPVDASTGWVYAIAMASVAIGAALGDGIGVRLPARRAEVLKTARMKWAAAGTIFLMAIAVLLFRAAVASSAEQSFGALSAIQVRALVSSGSVAFSWRGIPIALTPVVAGVGVAALAVSRKLGIATVFAAIGAAATTPERLSVVSTALTALVFWLLSQKASSERRPGRAGKVTVRRAVVVCAVLAVSLVYFQYEGHSLRKDSLSLGYPIVTKYIPGSLTVPYIYLEGGISGFAYAHQHHLDLADQPNAQGVTNRHSTIWVIERIREIFDHQAAVPVTTLPFVAMPAPTNVYGWVGDLYFDWGDSGVVIGGMLSGCFMAWLSKRFRVRGRLQDQWSLAAATVIFLFGIEEFQWLWLDTILVFGVGSALFRWVCPLVPGANRRGELAVQKVKL